MKTRTRQKIEETREIIYTEAELFERLQFYALNTGKVARGRDFRAFIYNYRNRWVNVDVFYYEMAKIFVKPEQLLTDKEKENLEILTKGEKDENYNCR